MVYAPKMPHPDGTVWACYSSYYVPPKPKPPPPEKTPEELRKEQIENIDQEIRDVERQIIEIENGITIKQSEIESLRKRLEEKRKQKEELQKERDTLQLTGVWVPDGAMEWLLHEVGHWVAATPEERRRPNYGLTASEYGHDGEREWQAWAFEEIILAPFGTARSFAPPTQRDGAAFAKTGPMPERHLRYAEQRIRGLGLDIEQWRLIWGAWVKWGKPIRSWDSPS